MTNMNDFFYEWFEFEWMFFFKIIGRIFHPRRLHILLIIVIATFSFSLSDVTFAQDNEPFELRSGVIADPDKSLIFVMNPKGGIDALDLETGTLKWSIDHAAKPLALSGNHLVCQIEPTPGENELKIAILNIEERGQIVSTNSIRLPSDVRVSISDGLKSRFNLYGRIQNDEFIISWKYSYRPVRGYLTLAQEHEKKEQSVPERDAPRITSGIIKLDLISGEMSAIKEEDLKIPLVPRWPNLKEAERLAGIKDVQFISSDGSHIMTSQRIADDRTWEKYRWFIYKRATGEQITEIKNHRPYMPFFIFKSAIIYETGSYTRRINDRLVDEPLKIRAVNLQTGAELWSWEIRDTKYRGPFPG